LRPYTDYLRIYGLIINFSTRDRSIMIGEENQGAWCWDHTYKTYDRRV